MKVCRGVSKNDRPDFMKTLGLPHQKFMPKLFPAGDAARSGCLKRPVSTASWRNLQSYLSDVLCLGCDLRPLSSSIAKSPVDFIDKIDLGCSQHLA